jgi:4-hydroxy-3-polyprenylbenzoate decarboxylase
VTSKSWVIGISGASGMRYALRTVEILAEKGFDLHIVCTESGLRVLREEEGLGAEQFQEKGHWYNPRDIGASIASGSFKCNGMLIVPCSMGTVGAIAAGLSTNLLQRAAEVTLKERRPLIIVPRETPLSTIHCENLAKLSRAGAAIVPAMPGFYHKPRTIEELIDMMVMKILDMMGVENEMAKRWQ